MKPICLIIPPSAFLLDERVFLTLGILRVAAVMEQAGLDVEMLDLSGVGNYEEAVADHAEGSGAEVFGLTATTPQMPAAMRIAAVLRVVRPAARQILGGPHITLVNAARKREVRNAAWNGRASRAFEELAHVFDCLVAGDGEEAVFEAMQPDAPKLIDADDVNSPLYLSNARLNELPFPARHLVDVESYHYAIDGERALSLIAQLGCPFGCGFCGGRESPMLRRIRTRTTENVVAEVEYLHERYGVNGFMLYDDELNVNPQMISLMTELAAAQARLGVEWRLRGFIKSNLFTDRQAEAMYKAGFRWILVGFESGSPRILENINKKATRAQNDACMEIARRHGLKVKALMSIGHPGESEETVRETHRWLLEQRPDDFDCTIITTYPGTPYYDRAAEETPGVWTYTCTKSGDRLHASEIDFHRVADFYKGGLDDYRSYVYTDHLSAPGLVWWRDHIERDVRAKLGIPFYAGAPGIRYEHSMGQGGALPASMLRKTTERETVCA